VVAVLAVRQHKLRCHAADDGEHVHHERHAILKALVKVNLPRTARAHRLRSVRLGRDSPVATC
jgi:hypothetical protein